MKQILGTDLMLKHKNDDKGGHEAEIFLLYSLLFGFEVLWSVAAKLRSILL